MKMTLEECLEKLDKYAAKWATCTDPTLARQLESAINYLMNKVEVLQREQNAIVQKEIDEWCFTIGNLMYYVENCDTYSRARHLERHINHLLTRVDYLYDKIINVD